MIREELDQILKLGCKKDFIPNVNTSLFLPPDPIQLKKKDILSLSVLKGLLVGKQSHPAFYASVVNIKFYVLQVKFNI